MEVGELLQFGAAGPVLLFTHIAFGDFSHRRDEAQSLLNGHDALGLREPALLQVDRA